MFRCEKPQISVANIGQILAEAGLPRQPPSLSATAVYAVAAVRHDMDGEGGE